MDSSPSSTSKLARVPLLSTEQRKNVLNFHWPFPKQPGFFYRWRSNATILAVFCLSKLVFCFNKIVVRPEQKQTFLKLLRDQNRPLITVCNHRCVMDDPFLWSMFTFREFLSNISRFRYILAAHDVCFTRNYHILFFSLGRCVPVVRGAGVFQQGVDYCLERLNTNGWVHIFPEGRVTRERLRIKWGIGRLIAESNKPPMLLPIWVRGMEDVWTTRAPYRPRFWKTVEVSIGDPIDTTIWLDGLSFADESELGRRKRLADLVQAELYGMGNNSESDTHLKEEKGQSGGPGRPKYPLLKAPGGGFAPPCPPHRPRVDGGVSLLFLFLPVPPRLCAEWCECGEVGRHSRHAETPPPPPQPFCCCLHHIRHPVDDNEDQPSPPLIPILSSSFGRFNEPTTRFNSVSWPSLLHPFSSSIPSPSAAALVLTYHTSFELTAVDVGKREEAGHLLLPAGDEGKAGLSSSGCCCIRSCPPNPLCLACLSPISLSALLPLIFRRLTTDSEQYSLPLFSFTLLFCSLAVCLPLFLFHLIPCGEGVGNGKGWLGECGAAAAAAVGRSGWGG
uniref:Tafazzin n=1 Tax=Globodera rostochiensis TaxID=31243 RepID=A0A914HBF8_GLORO